MVKGTSKSIGHVVFLLAALAFGASSVFGGGLPGWALYSFREAPELPTEGVPEHPFRVVYRERVINVAENGTLNIQVRSMIQALSSRSRVSMDYFPFHDGIKIRSSGAWHVTPPPKRKTVRAKASDWIDIKTDDSFLTTLAAASS